MFGDLFCQRGTYIDGIFYRNHMRYLREKDETDSHLTPPDEFKTRRQMIASGISSNSLGSPPRGGDLPHATRARSFGIKFQEKHDNVEGEFRRAQVRMKRAVAQVEAILVFDHFSSLRPLDWVLKHEAGVKLWVNRKTGEVSTYCPWEGTDGYRAPEEGFESEKRDERYFSDKLKNYNLESGTLSPKLQSRRGTLTEGGAGTGGSGAGSGGGSGMGSGGGSGGAESPVGKGVSARKLSSALRRSVQGQAGQGQGQGQGNVGIRHRRASAGDTLPHSGHVGQQEGEAEWGGDVDFAATHFTRLAANSFRVLGLSVASQHGHSQKSQERGMNSQERVAGLGRFGGEGQGHRGMSGPESQAESPHSQWLRDSGELETGTGSLVYEDSEINNFFAMLDSLK